MFISKIKTGFNNLTPGMTFKKYAKQVLYHGQNCGYIEMAGKRKYVLTPALEKLEHKLELNNFDPNMPRDISLNEFESFKNLLKPFIRNEKGIRKLNLSGDVYYSPSPASTLIWNKKTNEPIVTIIKKLKSPTTDIFYNAFPFFRKWHRVSPLDY